MGFFSWKCAKSGNSIIHRYAGRPDDESDCYLITPYEVIHETSYGGYGYFNGKDIYYLLGCEILGERAKAFSVDQVRSVGIEHKCPHFRIKVVMAKYYEGETYDDLPESEDCPYQGHFINFDDEVEDDEYDNDDSYYND